MHGFRSTATFTRPSDTAIYAAADAVSNATGSTHAVMTFDGMGGVGRKNCLRDIILIKSTATSTAAAFDLLLFDTAPVAMEDNAAADPSDTEILRLVASIRFAQVDIGVLGLNSFWQKTNLDIHYKTVSDTGGGRLYGVLVARETYTPGSAEVFTVLLKGEHD